MGSSDAGHERSVRPWPTRRRPKAIPGSRQKRLQREAQFAQQEARVQSSQLQQEVFADFERRIVPVLDTLRVEKRLHAIFAVQPEGGGLTLLSYDPGLDVSAEVVKRLNALK